MNKKACAAFDDLATKRGDRAFAFMKLMAE
jgi:hypothetical protein